MMADEFCDYGPILVKIVMCDVIYRWPLKSYKYLDVRAAMMAKLRSAI